MDRRGLTSVRLARDVEVVVSVLVVLQNASASRLEFPQSTSAHLSDEQGQERINILGSGRRVVDLLVIRVRVSDTNGLIQEYDVGLVGPTVWVVGDVDLVILALCDLTRSKLEQ